MPFKSKLKDAEWRLAWRIKNKDKLRKQRLSWEAKNKDKIKEYAEKRRNKCFTQAHSGI